MWVLTMPGMTYLPAASMIMSGSGHRSAALSPIRAMRPSSARRSVGPYAGVAGPGMTIACLISRRFTCFAWTGARAPAAGACAAGEPEATANPTAIAARRITYRI